MEGEQIFSFLAQNLAMDGSGTATITVDTLEKEIEIVSEGFDSVYLRNNEGVLEYSNDHAAWTPVSGGGEGTGDMLKSVYDPSENGYVDSAGELKNGEESLSFADMSAAKDTSDNFQFTASAFWLGEPSDVPITFKNEESSLKVSLDNGATWNVVTITPEV